MVGRCFFMVERVRQNRVIHNVVAKIQRTNTGRSQASCISPEHTLRELVPQIGPYLFALHHLPTVMAYHESAWH